MVRRAAFLLLAWAVVAVGPIRASDSTPRTSFWKKIIAKATPPDAGRLYFNVVTDIALPGPLPDESPTIVEDRIEIAVAGGIASTAWSAESIAEIDGDRQSEPTAAAFEHAFDPEQRFRASFLPSGRLLMEKRCKNCRAQWRKKWRLRVPGKTDVPPVLTETRIYYGAPDNRVYCLQKKNGYRLWDVDIGGRISRPLVLWSGTLPVPDDEDGEFLELLLALPDGGSRVIALDARTGQELARFDLGPEGGRIRGTPLPTPDGKIVIAREKYNAEDASLLVLELSRAASFAITVPTETAANAEDDPATPATPDDSTPAFREKKN